jgi:hypothetical protein
VYPNPQDALPLPPRPDLEQYRTRAKDLLAASRKGEPALLAWAGDWIAALERLRTVGADLSPKDRERRARQLTEFVRARLRDGAGRLADAQFVLARAHGFLSWRQFAAQLRELELTTSPAATFERAADAIVEGDEATLDRLLLAEPGLVHVRSRREHRATLLHYVSANGVEHYRQRTPGNIEPIARRLLDAGAEVDAEADVYGGGATTLGLVVTSAHPRKAGVQIALADLLLSRGARMDARIVNSCLQNGCPEAAAHLATRGALVGFVEAAGIGRTDLVRRAFEAPEGVPAKEAGEALVMAGWYGERATVELLLDLGVAPDTAGGEGQTALHVVAYQGDRELVELLLARGAGVNLADRVHGTSPLVWALHAWLVDERRDAATYRPVLLALVGAGARVRREWLDDERLEADPELHATLLRAADVG